MKIVNKKYMIVDVSEILEKFNVTGKVKWLNYSTSGKVEIEIELDCD